MVVSIVNRPLLLRWNKKKNKKKIQKKFLFMVNAWAMQEPHTENDGTNYSEVWPSLPVCGSRTLHVDKLTSVTLVLMVAFIG